ncbi:zinc finger and BTB domain-containing protein 14 isoform X3 [Nilaparvata lugens]|uniref:zinc finger and BTB domain-containing protein 14 isoform X2 n=1 Tax=Nilaparvata lugens TaxID=108931 RepID=UPI00193E147D|nr:zinc finger and BTB domain-containing protein 14 isoform X2 [Nilaparvata lugens]XP_039282427.1 zinc finger and BTB domain-containing protein 14 isoform X3 [Nilaparvata lugens]
MDNKGAMLDLLAAAAAVVGLSSEKPSPRIEAAANQKSTPNSKKQKHRTRLRTMSVSQLQSLSANQLINLFAFLGGDEMKKTFYYQCRFSPVCSKRFHSFGSEDRARLLIKDHLLKHVQNLKPDIQVDTPPKKQPKTVSPKKQIVRVLKKVDKVKMATSAAEQSVSSAHCYAAPRPDSPPPCRDCEREDTYNCGRLTMPYYLPDSSPSETVIIDFKADQKTVILREPAADTRMNEAANNVCDQEVIDDWLSVCQEEVVVSTDETPFVVDTEQIVNTTPEGCNVAYIDIKHEIKTEEPRFDGEEGEEMYNEEQVNYTEEQVVFNEEQVVVLKAEEGEEMYNNMRLEKERKPKGKAKFIGQSDAEKQMAMQMIKAVRRKQVDTDRLECKICKPPRLFTAPTTLISHYRSHAGIKPYECPLCKSVFTRQHSLNYHILIHMNQTRFTCEVCDRKFRHPSHFKEHQRRHTGESPFECDDCSLRFKTRNTYKRHLKTRHGKVLTQTGDITMLSEEEFRRVRTCPRQRQPHATARDLDKENSRRPPQVFANANANTNAQPTTKARLVIMDAAAGHHHDDVITVSLPISDQSPPPTPTITLLTPNNINYFPPKASVS